jgi:o-succinylbenzoate---CoA ligase
VITHDPVRFWAAVQPGRPALRSARSVWTYAELDRAVWAAADALLAKGLGAGEHVSLEFAAEDPVAFAVALHAVHRIGSLPVIVGPNATAAERQAMRERAAVDFTLTAGDLDIPLLDGAPSPEAAASEATAAAPRESAPLTIERRLDAPAAVCFTSGTSGAARAVALTHGNFLWSAIASARNLGVRAGDLWLCPMPLHHVGGLSIVIRSALYGTTALLHERFDADAVHHAIDQEGVTLLSVVPTMLARLLESRQDRPYPASLRAVLVGGGPIAPALLENAAALGMRALPTYGLTEAASQVTTLPPGEWPRGLSTAGRPLPFVQVEIRDTDDRRVAPGEEGEIVVRGPMVMAGYLGDPADTQAALSRRWLRTGDVGRWDPEGLLVVLDRRADRIVTGGENVSPEEVERVLGTYPGVAAACVVALPSREWGQEVAAAVELRPGRSITLEEMRAHAGATLSGFKLPRHLITVRAMPRTPSGKLLRRVVRELLLDEMAKQKHP